MRVSNRRLRAKIYDSIIYLTGSQHHATTDGVKGVSGETNKSSNGPVKEESGKKVALERTGEDKGHNGVVYGEVQTT
jgi:hypothetical protein